MHTFTRCRYTRTQSHTHSPTPSHSQPLTATLTATHTHPATYSHSPTLTPTHSLTHSLSISSERLGGCALTRRHASLSAPSRSPSPAPRRSPVCRRPSQQCLCNHSVSYSAAGRECSAGGPGGHSRVVARPSLPVRAITSII